MTRNRFLSIVAIIAFLLSIPLIAMQFTNEVNWSFVDFLAMTILLLAFATIGDFIIRKITTKKHRIAVLAVTLLFFSLIWAELAVGIFNSPLAGT